MHHSTTFRRKLVLALAMPPRRSVGRERVLVVKLELGILLLFAQKAVTGRQYLDLSPHEASERVLGGGDDWFAPDVEAGVDDDRTPRARLESRQQRVISRVSVGMDGLNTRRVVHVRHGGDRRVRNVELVDPEEGMLGRRHLTPMLLGHVSHEQHVRTVVIEVEPLVDVLTEDRGGEWSKGLAVLHLEIQNG